MAWRDKHKVHPAADVFPMMSDDELKALGEDIRANGLHNCFVLDAEEQLIDGRNRMEAMERAGIEPDEDSDFVFDDSDPVAYVISANIRRRHLTKQQQADLIVAAIKAGAEISSRQDGEVTKRHVEGKRGSEKDPVKEAAVAAGAEHDISERTIERAIAKASGKTPKPKAPKPPVEMESDAPGGVEDSTLVVSNVLNALEGTKALAKAFRKTFKASIFSREQKERIEDSLNSIIAVWEKALSDARNAPEPLYAEPDGDLDPNAPTVAELIAAAPEAKPSVVLTSGLRVPADDWRVALDDEQNPVDPEPPKDKKTTAAELADPKCKTCGGKGRVPGRTGQSFDCACVKKKLRAVNG